MHLEKVSETCFLQFHHCVLTVSQGWAQFFGFAYLRQRTRNHLLTTDTIVLKNTRRRRKAGDAISHLLNIYVTGFPRFCHVFKRRAHACSCRTTLQNLFDRMAVGRGERRLGKVGAEAGGTSVAELKLFNFRSSSAPAPAPILCCHLKIGKFFWFNKIKTVLQK